MNEYNLKRLFDVIKNNLRHQYYEKVCDLHTLYKQLITGEGIDDLMKQFVMREDGIMFKQRKELTQHIVTSVSKNLMDVTYKIPRSTSKKTVLRYGSGQSPEEVEKEKEVIKILSDFYGNVSWSEWLDTRMIELAYIDPNAWVVFEFKPTNGTNRVDPYPFEIPSEQAIYFEQFNGVIEFIVGEFENEYMFNGEINKGIKYTLYGKTEAITAFETKTTFPVDEYRQYGDGLFYVQLNNKTYQIVISEGYNTGGKVPAFRCGYKRDLSTDGNTFINGFHSAVPYMKKSIKINSEKDLTDCLLAFPKKIAYQNPCVECQGMGQVSGQNEGEYIKCPKCKGEGVQISTSVQDAMIIKLPPNPQAGELIDITKLVHYEYAPVEIAKYQQEQIDYLTEQCRRVVFNSDIYDKKEISDTATGKNIDMQNVYDSLYDFSLHYSRLWMFGINIMSRISNLNEGLNYSMTFGRDFKLKSKNDLLAELQLAKNAGASDFIIKTIEDDIVMIDLADNPVEMKRFEAMKFFDPFNGKTPDEVAFIIGSLPRYDFDRVMWLKMGKLFDELELEYPDFLFFERSKQKEIIKSKIEEYITEIKELDSLSMPKLNLNA